MGFSQVEPSAANEKLRNGASPRTDVREPAQHTPRRVHTVEPPPVERTAASTDAHTTRRALRGAARLPTGRLLDRDCGEVQSDDGGPNHHEGQRLAPKMALQVTYALTRMFPISSTSNGFSDSSLKRASSEK